MTADFTRRLADVPDGSLADGVVRGVAEIIGTDMAVLTVLDPQSGRHFRQGRSWWRPIRDRCGDRPRRRHHRPGPPRPEARQGWCTPFRIEERSQRAAPRRRGRRIAAGCGRAAADPAGPRHRHADHRPVRSRGDLRSPRTWRILELVSPVIALAIGAELNRQENEHGSPRDALTGLYNRAYLDAALDQLLALRLRSAAR